MKYKKNYFVLLYVLSLFMILLPIGVGLFYWDKLSNKVAIHFSFDGTANGFCDKITAVYFFPILLSISQLVIIISYVFSKKQNIPPAVELPSIFILPFCGLYCAYSIYKEYMKVESNIMPIIFLILLLGVLFLFIFNFIKWKKNS